MGKQRFHLPGLLSPLEFEIVERLFDNLPNGEEREAKEKTSNAANIRHQESISRGHRLTRNKESDYQGVPRVDKLLLLMQDVGSGCPKNDLIDKGTFKLGTLQERKTSKVLLSRFDFSFSPENLQITNTSNDYK